MCHGFCVYAPEGTIYGAVEGLVVRGRVDGAWGPVEGGSHACLERPVDILRRCGWAVAHLSRAWRSDQPGASNLRSIRMGLASKGGPWRWPRQSGAEFPGLGCVSRWRQTGPQSIHQILVGSKALGTQGRAWMCAQSSGHSGGRTLGRFPGLSPSVPRRICPSAT